MLAGARRHLARAWPSSEGGVGNRPWSWRVGKSTCSCGAWWRLSRLVDARPGSKHHLIVDGQGIPLAVSLTGGNRDDVTQLLPLLDKIPPVAGRAGRSRRRPDALLADRGYDHDKYRRLLRQRGIRPVIAERGQPDDTGLDIFRYVVEGTIAWLHGFRRCASTGNDATTSTKRSSASPSA